VVKCLEVDPTNPARLFLGTYWGGLQYSEDSGSSWSEAQVTDVEDTASVQEIVALADGRVLAAFSDGVYQSTDHGHTFARTFPELANLGEDEVEYVDSIIANPDQPDELFACTAKTWPVFYNRGSVWHSTDGGTSWLDITGDLPVHRVRDLEISGDFLYAATWCGHVYRTDISGGGTEPQPCVPGPTTMCLNQGRFQVEVTWRDFEDNTGPARVVEFGSEDSGLFWFFSESNWEMLVKVLNGCAITDHYWVFAAATTNVGYTLTVTDTVTGEHKSYVNQVGVSAPAVTDTSALAVCP
jgi:hypothetical protein